MQQQNKTRLKVAGAVTALGLLVVASTGMEEGLRLYVYRDVVGVYTYCYGETKGAKALVGHRFTKDECDVLFIDRLIEFEQDMRSCVNRPDDIPDKAYVAYLDTAYNIGAGAWCRSSMVRDLNAGRSLKSCDDLMKYTRAGGRVIKGLVDRRKRKVKMCKEGWHLGTISPSYSLEAK